MFKTTLIVIVFISPNYTFFCIIKMSNIGPTVCSHYKIMGIVGNFHKASNDMISKQCHRIQLSNLFVLPIVKCYSEINLSLSYISRLSGANRIVRIDQVILCMPGGGTKCGIHHTRQIVDMQRTHVSRTVKQVLTLSKPI